MNSRRVENLDENLLPLTIFKLLQNFDKWFKIHIWTLFGKQIDGLLEWYGTKYPEKQMKKPEQANVWLNKPELFKVSYYAIYRKRFVVQSMRYIANGLLYRVGW